MDTNRKKPVIRILLAIITIAFFCVTFRIQCNEDFAKRHPLKRENEKIKIDIIPDTFNGTSVVIIDSTPFVDERHWRYEDHTLDDSVKFPIPSQWILFDSINGKTIVVNLVQRRAKVAKLDTNIAIYLPPTAGAHAYRTDAMKKPPLESNSHTTIPDPTPEKTTPGKENSGGTIQGKESKGKTNTEKEASEKSAEEKKTSGQSTSGKKVITMNKTTDPGKKTSEKTVKTSDPTVTRKNTASTDGTSSGKGHPEGSDHRGNNTDKIRRGIESKLLAFFRACYNSPHKQPSSYAKIQAEIFDNKNNVPCTLIRNGETQTMPFADLCLNLPIMHHLTHGIDSVRITGFVSPYVTSLKVYGH